MEEYETFAYLTFPKISPEKGIIDYLHSKKETTILRKFLQWDIPRVEPALRLVSLRRDLEEIQERLVKKKTKREERRKEMDEQWKELDLDAKKLRETFQEFNQMIKQNAQKRDRATKKSQKQQTLQTEKEQQIEELKVEHNKLIQIKDKMEEQIKKQQLYEDYLQTIVETCPQYKTVDDVYNRFGTLQETRNAITQKINSSLMEAEEYKDEIIRLEKIYNSAVIGLNNHLINLHKRYTTAKNEAQKWEMLIKNVQEELEKRFLEILKVKRSCWNIYLEMCKRKKVKPKFDQSDFENHLWYIRSAMLRIKKTLEMAQEGKRKKISSLLVEKPMSKQHK